MQHSTQPRRMLQRSRDETARRIVQTSGTSGSAYKKKKRVTSAIFKKYLQCVLTAKILIVDFVVCTLAVGKKKIRAGFDMSDRTIPLSVPPDKYQAGTLNFARTTSFQIIYTLSVTVPFDAILSEILTSYNTLYKKKCVL
jgi:hypothetical protein